MGGLMSLISADNHKKGIDIVLNFEDCKPTGEEETVIYDEVSAILAKGPEILEDLTGYSGCEDYIRKAITTPGPETEEKAWEMVLPAVDKLKEFYDFSIELEECFPKLLLQLCTGTVTENIKDQESLAKLLADVFDFVLRFDDAKMVNPAIQNDFSYYRRTLNRMKLSKKDMNLTIRDELANRMSLFFAYPTPMMKVLSDTSASFLEKDASVSKESVNEALAVMANVCQHMVEIGSFESDELNLYCLRAMTGAVILFDHVSDTGAFNKKTPVNIRGVITSLKNFGSGSSGGSSPAAGLLNALRFTTVHLNDADTPSSIKQLLA